MRTRLKDVAENRELSRWWRLLRRDPRQLNRPHESDAELLPLPGTDQLLALTTDTVAEECLCGLYREPETVGWVAATASLSDLAAVGAQPLGLLVAVTLPGDEDGSVQDGLARGLDAACRGCDCAVLGGDTNHGDRLSVTTTAAGLVPRDRLLQRVGCRAGDLIFATARLGAGAACAARSLAPDPARRVPESAFRPRARVAEGRLLAGLATAGMDTSDGLIATLDQLARLNSVGMEIDTPLKLILNDDALAVGDALGVEPLALLAQPHGEFELVFTMRPEDAATLATRAHAGGWAPVRIGRVTAAPGLRLASEPPRAIDGARLRDLAALAGSEPRRYAAALIAALGTGPA